VQSGASALDFSSMSELTFEAMGTGDHKQRFPGLSLAWAVLNAPPGTTAVLNAANEVAVAAFLERRIRFDQIHHVNMETLGAVAPEAPRSLEDLLALDQKSRRAADHAIQCLPT
jgi:1-deoxy-D-xylulose-5-phosphate reductoisomerase